MLSDSSNGVLSALLFLAAVSAIGVSVAGVKDYKEAAVNGTLASNFWHSN